MSRRMIYAAVSMLTLWSGATLAQPIGIATGPQGTMTFAAGTAISKVLVDGAATQSRLQPLSGSVGILPLVNSVPYHSAAIDYFRASGIRALE